jgi:tellurite resistance protein TerC
MYFLLADLLDRFIYLKLGLALVLMWVGVKMLLLEVIHVPTLISLGVIALILTVAVVASLRATRADGQTTSTDAASPDRDRTPSETAGQS